eukprot:9783904-Lingulodinium_polyedra.AAC.1
MAHIPRKVRERVTPLLLSALRRHAAAMQALAAAKQAARDREEAEELEAARWLWLAPALLLRGPGAAHQLEGKERQEAHAK